MLLLYFTTEEHPAYAKTTYSQREKLRKDNILQHAAPVSEWVKRSYLAVTDMDYTSQLLYATQHFMGNYPLTGCGLSLYADKNPKGISKDSHYYSFRETLDKGIKKEELENIKSILSIGIMVAVDEVLEHRAPDVIDLPAANTNPCHWFKRVHRFIMEDVRKGKFDHLSSWNKHAIKLACSLIMGMVGSRSYVYTDVAEVLIDIENHILEQIRYSIENYEWYVTVKWHMNKEEQLKKYTLTDEEIAQAKEQREADLIPIRAREKAEAEKHKREWEEYREQCRAIEQLRDARMEAYDRACDRAGMALPYMF